MKNPTYEELVQCLFEICESSDPDATFYDDQIPVDKSCMLAAYEMQERILSSEARRA